ncbi:hypothetical protein BJ508DRAFT_332472 [Ascobolus immersus RN42]|uniref:Uncharacterized protein n=1 Tax=Ascobolus immersus RN42 TaxID=1160509 RepID=A0A3N4HTH4_ASCIM|nr:hypothetical protein BJ508DRAFT_332472 [Ascobolus immersus RN42]
MEDHQSGTLIEDTLDWQTPFYIDTPDTPEGGSFIQYLPLPARGVEVRGYIWMPPAELRSGKRDPIEGVELRHAAIAQLFSDFLQPARSASPHMRAKLVIQLHGAAIPPEIDTTDFTIFSFADLPEEGTSHHTCSCYPCRSSSATVTVHTMLLPSGITTFWSKTLTAGGMRWVLCEEKAKEEHERAREERRRRNEERARQWEYRVEVDEAGYAEDSGCEGCNGEEASRSEVRWDDEEG